MTNLMNMMDKKVLVTYTNYAGETVLTFEGKVFDVNVDNEVLWVERYEDGELFDTYDVDLKDPKRSVEVIEEKELEVEVNETQDLKSIKKDLLKAVRWLEGDVSVAIKVYDCSENNEQTYDVEINYYVDGEYQDGFYNQTFNGRFGDNEDELAEKMAVKRAKSVHKTVRKWFEYSDVEVANEVEVYHV